MLSRLKVFHRKDHEPIDVKLFIKANRILLSIRRLDLSDEVVICNTNII